MTIIAVRNRPHLLSTGDTVHIACPTTAVPPAAKPERRTEYGHLTPLFAEYGGLPPGDARRGPLRAMLIAGHMRVAQNIARKYRHRGENPDDIEQVATLGLVLAVDRFDPARGPDFLSYAIPTINGEVQRYFRDQSTVIRMPRRLRELLPLIYDAAAELGQRQGRAARPSEIATLLDLDREVVLECIQAQQVAHCFSLDEPARGDAGSTGATRFETALRQTEPHFDLVENRHALGPLLAALPERERRLLVLRFFNEMTQSEIAHEIGISQMHVSRLLTRTLARLRRELHADVRPAHEGPGAGPARTRRPPVAASA